MKIIISENKLEKLNEFLNSRGPLFVIRMIGGYNNFIKLFPDYFESKENKIKLLNELIWATIQVWEFDKNDELVDEDGFDAYDIKFDELDRRVFNQIFESMVNYLLL